MRENLGKSRWFCFACACARLVSKFRVSRLLKRSSLSISLFFNVHVKSMSNTQERLRSTLSRGLGREKQSWVCRTVQCVNGQEMQRRNPSTVTRDPHWKRCLADRLGPVGWVLIIGGTRLADNVLTALQWSDEALGLSSRAGNGSGDVAVP